MSQTTPVVPESQAEPGEALTRAFERYQAALELYYVRRTMREFQSARTKDGGLTAHYERRAEELRNVLGVTS